MSRVGQVRSVKGLRFLKICNTIINFSCLQAEILVKMDKLHDASRIVSWILEQKPFNVKAAQHLANIYGLSQQHTQVSNLQYIFWNCLLNPTVILPGIFGDVMWDLGSLKSVKNQSKYCMFKYNSEVPFGLNVKQIKLNPNLQSVPYFTLPKGSRNYYHHIDL